LKWPNDIYAKTSDGLKKIGGILITSEYLPETSNFALTIGCGINVLNSKPSTCLQDLGEEKIEMELVLALILEEFETLYQELVKANLSFDCFSTFRERYYQHWLHTGQEVTVHGENGVLENMIIQGLDTSGFLKAVSKIDGSVSVLQPDGNSFDMLKNLITVKQ
jgi:biotin--protein ligase